MRTLKEVRNGPYTVIVQPADEGGFWAEVVELPGCYSQGETEEELRANIQDAIKTWLEAPDEEDSSNAPVPDVWRIENVA